MLLALVREGEVTAATDEVLTIAAKANSLALEYGPRVIAAIVILVLGWFLARLVTGGVRRALARSRVDPTLANFLASLTYFALLAFVVVATISKLGVETASFVAILGAAGFAVGFALQGSLANFASGVMLMIFRPFKAGDVVEAAGTSGKVVEVGIFATIFTTPDNKKVIVSNSAIMGGNITNYSAMETRRIDLVFGISYGDDMRKAKAVVQRVCDADPRILKDPAVQVAVSDLADSSVNLVCRPWVGTADYWAVRFDLIEAVKAAFDAEGISIPFPQRDVHMHSVA